jgi:hypothetical protein
MAISAAFAAFRLAAASACPGGDLRLGLSLVPGPNLVERHLGQMFDADEHVLDGASPGRLVKLGLNGGGIAILGVLNQKHHQEGYDGRSCVHDEADSERDRTTRNLCYPVGEARERSGRQHRQRPHTHALITSSFAKRLKTMEGMQFCGKSAAFYPRARLSECRIAPGIHPFGLVSN